MYYSQYAICVKNINVNIEVPLSIGKEYLVLERCESSIQIIDDHSEKRWFSMYYFQPAPLRPKENYREYWHGDY